MRKPAGQKPGSETKLGPGLCRCRRKVRATICRDRPRLSLFNLPHAYFYGNWRAKVPNILQDVRSYRQSRGDPAVLAGRRGPRPSTGIGSEVPINVRKRFGYFCPRRRRGYFRRLLRRQVGLPVEASAEDRAFIRFRRGVCRDSRFWSLHLQSARPGANTEDKVRCSHLTPCHTAGSRPAHA